MDGSCSVACHHIIRSLNGAQSLHPESVMGVIVLASCVCVHGGQVVGYLGQVRRSLVKVQGHKLFYGHFNGMALGDH